MGFMKSLFGTGQGGGKPTGDGGGHAGPPSAALQAIYRALDAPATPENFMEELGSGKAQAALNALLDYCERQAPLQVVVKEFNVSREDLEELYQQLLFAGDGQWRGGHFVAAAALAYPDSLRYLLRRSREKGREEGRLQTTAYNLLVYFEHGKALPS